MIWAHSSFIYSCIMEADVKRVLMFFLLLLALSPLFAFSFFYGAGGEGERLDDENLLRSLDKKIAIGQGYKGKSPELGVGSCCLAALHSVKGCPAKADDIINMLRSYLS